MRDPEAMLSLLKEMAADDDAPRLWHLSGQR